jgi:hypothetical protein
MVVHQPRWSLFSLFDDVLLLGKARPYAKRVVEKDTKNLRSFSEVLP